MLPACVGSTAGAVVTSLALPWFGQTVARNPLELNRARLRARRRAFPSPLRGGVGVGGRGSNSDVGTWARRPYNAWFAATALYACAPTPLGLSGRVGPPRKGEGRRRRFEALLQSERIMLYRA